MLYSIVTIFDNVTDTTRDHYRIQLTGDGLRLDGFRKEYRESRRHGWKAVDNTSWGSVNSWFYDRYKDTMANQPNVPPIVIESARDEFLKNFRELLVWREKA